MGRLVRASWELFWTILAVSWAILGDLGVKLGPCWQHVGIKMAKMSQDRRTWEENGWLWATRYANARSVRARVGGCLELEFSIWKDWTDWIRDLTRRGACLWQGAGGFIQCAARAKPPPCRICGWKFGSASYFISIMLNLWVDVTSLYFGSVSVRDA